MLRAYWKIFDIFPETPVPINVQKIYRTPNGSLYSDSVGYQYRVPSKRSAEDTDVAYIDVRVLEEHENNDYINDFRLIEIDEQETDAAISSLITRELDLDWKNNRPPYITDFQRQGAGAGGIRRDNINLIQEELIPRYSVWCELHNRLMISPPKARYYYNATPESVFPSMVYMGNNAEMISWTHSIANSWSKKWSIVATIDNQISSIKSYSRFSTAEKFVKKYIKKLLDNRKFRDFPNFKRHSFVHDTGNGVLEIKFYKEKELAL